MGGGGRRLSQWSCCDLQLPHQEAEAEKNRFTFEELKKREFLDGVRVLLPAVWSGLHVVCILLDGEATRRSNSD